MKINNATSLLELQKLVLAYKLDLHVNYVGSAACYRAVVVGPSKDDETKPTSATGVGRTLGEAVADAVAKYEETHQ